MIEFRDAQAREKGFELLVHVNEQGVRDGIGPLRMAPMSIPTS